MCLLYADDALVFLQLTEQQMKIFKVIMQLFKQLSGLKVNLQKSAILLPVDTKANSAAVGQYTSMQSGGLSNHLFGTAVVR
jgi:hypothetical protein